MTTTLLAHEFRRTGGTVASVLGGAALVVLVGSLLALTDWPLLATLGVVAGFAAVAVLLPILCLALGIEYWRSAYGRSGYLTHSLPVAGSRIYAVRLLHGLIVSVVGTVVAGLLLLPLLAASVAHEAPTGTSALSYVLDTGRQGLSAANPLVVVAVVVAVVLAAWGGLVCFYFAASIGSGPRLAAWAPPVRSSRTCCSTSSCRSCSSSASSPCRTARTSTGACCGSCRWTCGARGVATVGPT